MSVTKIKTTQLYEGQEFVKRDGSVALTGNLNAGSNRITNIATIPLTDTDAASKYYVDSVASGLDLKQSVRAATTGNITLSGIQTIDSVLLQVGNRVLVKDQTNGSENGIYIVSSGAWSRSTDADSNDKVTTGLFCFVEEGTTNSATGWVLITPAPITLGTTSLTFTQFSASTSLLAGAGLVKNGNQLDVGAGNGIIVNADSVEVKGDRSRAIDVDSNGVYVRVKTNGGILIDPTDGLFVNPALFNTVFGEIATITSATTAAIAHIPRSGTLRVYLNGQRLTPGITQDYITIDNIIHFNFNIEESTDIIVVDYIIE